MNHETVLLLVSAIWVALELLVGVISRRSEGRSVLDRGSHTILWVLLVASIFAASAIHRLPIGRMPDLFWLGVALILVGIAIRATAIVTLRRFFTVRVTIQESHELIERGIYKIVRHPSYSGALVSFIGLGFAFGNWLSLAIILAGALTGFAYRIRVEEAALSSHFGEQYRQYAARTKRLIPGVY
ncbi:MAG: protein-S-isoprenylcysteine methyltransferase [Acidobacteria bacterium]|nr:MAG: protein-S-isoprenylcysteine methyltransferase [Acidobacteriota bacterium]